MAALALALAAGCDDRQDKSSQKELAVLRKECEALRQKARLAAEKADAEKRALNKDHENQLAAATQQAAPIGEQLDHIRQTVDKALADMGRTVPLASGDRTSVAKLVDEFVDRFGKLNAELDDQKKTCQDLQQDLARLNETLRHVTAQLSPSAATQTDTPRLLPQP